MPLNANNAWMRAIPFKNAVQSCLFLVSSHAINIGDLRFLLFFTCDVFYNVDIMVIKYLRDFITLPTIRECRVTENLMLFYLYTLEFG